MKLNNIFLEKYQLNDEKKEVSINRLRTDNYDEKLGVIETLSTQFSWLSYKVIDVREEFDFKYGLLNYYGKPGGNGLEKFIKSLFKISEEVINYDDDFLIEFFVSSVCPHCPAAFDVLIDILSSFSIKTNIYFSEDTPEKLEKMGVLSVPTLIIKREYDEVARWTGKLFKDDIIKVLKGSGVEKLSEDYFINLLEQGNAEKVAGLVFDGNRIFDGFKQLFENEKWSVRLGAIVAAEYLSGLSYELYEDLLDYLNTNYFRVSDQIKGDIIYLFSLSSNKAKWINNIREITKNEENIELLEAAIEAIEELST